MKRLHLLIFLCSMLVSAVSSAQFRVVSSSIANGAINIGTRDTISLTFSSAIDTTRVISIRPVNRFIRYALSPADTLQHAIASVSTDLKTVRIPLSLYPNREYLFAMYGAFSAIGDSVAVPFFVKFSTGSLISTRTVSGTVTLTGGSPVNSVVLLVPEHRFKEEMYLEPLEYPVAATLVTDPNGTFQINYVAPGRYYAIGVKDLNGNGRWRIFDGDAHGAYDPNADLIPDTLLVHVGQDRSGIAIGLSPLDITTTDSSASRAAARAQTWSADAKLLAVHAPDTVDNTGRAHGWVYTYYSAQRNAVRRIAYSGARLLYVFQRYPMPHELNFRELPANWVSSAVALEKAGLAGGTAFRASHTNSFITAGVYGGGTSGAVVDKPVWIVIYSHVTPLGVKPDIKAIILDAATGDTIGVAKTTAQQAVDLTAARATRWASDARLISVGSSGAPDSGRFAGWLVWYYSGSLRRSNVMTVTGNDTSKIFERAYPDSSFHPRPSIQAGWIDSRTALDSATAFWQFLATRTEVTLSMFLKSEITQFPQDTLSYWYISYTGKDSLGRPGFGFVRIRAVPGVSTTRVSSLAFELKPTADSIAALWSSDAKLVRIHSLRGYTVDSTGKSPAWEYFYRADTKPSILHIKVASRTSFFSREERLPVNAPLHFAPLPPADSLVNSNVAVSVADDYVDSVLGFDYRQQLPLNQVGAALENVRINRDSAKAIWVILYPYSSATANRNVLVAIDARTGVVLNRAVKTTERTPFQTALVAAKEWSADAVFRYAKADSVDSTGLVQSWLFGFYSQSKALALFIEVTAGNTVTDMYESTSLPPRFAAADSIRNWLESNIAILRADSVLGRSLRLQNRLARAMAELVRLGVPGGSSPGNSFRIGAASDAWLITYYTTDGQTLTLTIGETGEVTSVEERLIVPASFDLEQNYPNPFNPTTTIRFALPVASRVKLEIYNILGQKITTLLDEERTAGIHPVQWRGNVASGVYFYRLEATPINDPQNRFVQLRKMVLIR
ncbi:MAG TPA: T9SS type A sorting domain-containing protein [Bacteroidota bacterium]|nr:T9SS type A sorting domain-containing protein [Bacteroidota bacterium]